VLKKFIGLRRLFWLNISMQFTFKRCAKKLPKNTKIPYRLRFKVIQDYRC